MAADRGRLRLSQWCGLGLLLAASCGGPSLPTPSSEFTSEHAELFEDGVDFVPDPRVLSRHWRTAWDRKLHLRVKWADYVGVVRVLNVLAEQDPDRRTSYRLLARVEKGWLGEAPDELLLLSRAGQLGADSVGRGQQRLLEGQYIVFLKWYRDPFGNIGAHWHLAPASQVVTHRTGTWLQRLRNIQIESRATRIKRTIRGN